MKRAVCLALLASLAAGQGGRDSGAGATPVLFVRWRHSVESDSIYRAAWRALEPHFGLLSRRRLFEFDANEKTAKVYFEKNSDAGVVVAFGAKAAELAARHLPGAEVLRVDQTANAHVVAQASRERFAWALRLLAPKAERIACFGSRAEPLSGYEVKLCKRVEDAADCDLAWIPEGAADPGELTIPIVSTSGALAEGRAVLTLRPDPAGLGHQVAAQVLRWMRNKRKFHPVHVLRMRLTVDLRAAREAEYSVPLRLLARADVVRRAP